MNTTLIKRILALFTSVLLIGLSGCISEYSCEDLGASLAAECTNFINGVVIDGGTDESSITGVVIDGDSITVNGVVIDGDK